MTMTSFLLTSLDHSIPCTIKSQPSYYIHLVPPHTTPPSPLPHPSNIPSQPIHIHIALIILIILLCPKQRSNIDISIQHISPFAQEPRRGQDTYIQDSARLDGQGVLLLRGTGLDVVQGFEGPGGEVGVAG